jgi:hypothetical protein
VKEFEGGMKEFKEEMNICGETRILTSSRVFPISRLSLLLARIKLSLLSVSASAASCMMRRKLPYCVIFEKSSFIQSELQGVKVVVQSHYLL